MNETININMQRHNTILGVNATKDSEAIYMRKCYDDIRTSFFHDTDRIIYSLSYIRYMKKCQVFARRDNDHLQSRMLHVQYVSKIARTIGRALGLNEDLIEAAALGHDLGHTPYGHEGERILNVISNELGEGNFFHNVNSVRNLLFVENYGRGHNISIQVLDAIMCHNGEIVSHEYYPKPKSCDDFLKEYYKTYEDVDTARYLRPMTLEGCVVRISDIIAYLGRDIEDGIRKGLVSFEDIPSEITSVLGNNNSDIVKNIINDIIKNSIGLPYIKMSDEIFTAITSLKKFNYENIYSKSLTSKEKELLEKKFRFLVKTYINDIKTNNEKSTIISSYLNNMSEEYKENTPERIAIDYISGMTDDYFDEQYQNIKNK